MAVISFLMDNKEGHIIPSLQLAHDLKANGHQIVYLTISDNEAMVRGQGFGFFPIFPDLYPVGFNESNKRNMDQEVLNRAKRMAHLSGIIQGALDTFFEKIKPELFISSAFLNLEMILLHYKYGIHPVMLTTYLRPPGRTLYDECIDDIMDLPPDITEEIIDFIANLGILPSSLKELLQPLNIFHELILCPMELDMEPVSERNKVHNIGPSIFHARHSGDHPDLEKIGNGMKIIYASLGSYAVSYGAVCDNFFRKLTGVMKDPATSGLHLILSVGLEFDTESLGGLPENVTIMKWAAQTDILRISSLVITHGGLGTIKESIFYGVPMIVLPIRYDQVRNATLVHHHRLGVTEQIECLTEATLLHNILHVLGSKDIGENIRKMQHVFREKEDSREGVHIIERLLAN